MSKKQPNIENQDLDKTIVFDSDDIQSGQLKIKVNAYPILEGEFERLINSGSGLKEWSRRFLLISLGALIIVIAKVIDFSRNFSKMQDKNDVDLKIENYELIALSISIGLCILFFLAGLIFRNKKDQLISKIKGHFNSDGNV